jgi:hypothetical protein
MTLNGLRVPCLCRRCAGKSRDYRTVALHAARDEADRPLFQRPVDDAAFNEDNIIEQKVESEDEPALPPNYPEEDVELDDIVSHVEAMANCNMPIYESVQRSNTRFHYTTTLNNALYMYRSRNVPI